MTHAMPVVHAERSGKFALPLPLDQTLALFTPLGEKHWVLGWNPQFCYPVSGLPEVGAVFLTTHADEATTIWVMTHYAPADGQIRYARTTPHLAAGTVVVQCSAITPLTTTVRVQYHMTALSEVGNEFVATYAQAHDLHWISAWEAAILHYLQHGYPSTHS